MILRVLHWWVQNLRNSNLKYVDFGKADLQNSNLRKAKLKNTNFKNSDLRNSNLTNTNFNKRDHPRVKISNAALPRKNNYNIQILLAIAATLAILILLNNHIIKSEILNSVLWFFEFMLGLGLLQSSILGMNKDEKSW